MAEPSRPRTGLRVLIAGAVLVAGGLAGFLAEHARPVPDGTAGVDWSSVCQGRDGEDMHRLLGDSPTATVTSGSSRNVSDSGFALNAVCAAGGSGGTVSVIITSLGTGEGGSDMVKDLSRKAPGSRPFGAGEAAAATSTTALAEVACRSTRGPEHFEVKLDVTGSAARGPLHVARMENIVRAWATAMSDGKNCGAAL